MIAFILTMPGNNSWNGRFSGENNLYAVLKKENGVPKDIIGKDFDYNFGDGWWANVEVKKINDRSKINRIRKKSSGFMGYNWMIESILKNKEILKPQRGKSYGYF